MLPCPVIGLTVGFYDGFFGPGTGTILILLFTGLLKMDMVNASGAAKLVNLASNVAAMVSLVIGGKVLFQLAVPAMVCSAVGGYHRREAGAGGGREADPNRDGGRVLPDPAHAGSGLLRNQDIKTPTRGPAPVQHADNLVVAFKRSRRPVRRNAFLAPVRTLGQETIHPVSAPSGNS